MSVLIYGIILFLIAIFIHMLLWKIHLPQNHTKVLLTIFLGVLIGGIFILWKLLFNVRLFGISSPRLIFEYLQLSLFFISLVLSYIVTYSALEVDSPSLRIVLGVAEAGNSGLDIQTLGRKMTDELLVIPRIRDLAKDKMIYLEADRYRLTSKGVLLARIFVSYRKLLNLGKGG